MSREEEIRAAAMQIAVAIWGSPALDGLSEDGHELEEAITEYLPIARRIEWYIRTGK
jgi:hypothetical protein